jgi:hypothetical protein
MSRIRPTWVVVDLLEVGVRLVLDLPGHGAGDLGEDARKVAGAYLLDGVCGEASL